MQTSIVLELPESLIGKAICWKTSGQFSHAVVYESPWKVEALMLGGVISTFNARYAPEGSMRYDISFTVPQILRGREFLDEEWRDGKGYDFRAILSFLVNSRKQDADRWFCSELAYAYLNACAPEQFPEVDYLVTPEDLRRILDEKIADGTGKNIIRR